MSNDPSRTRESARGARSDSPESEALARDVASALRRERRAHPSSRAWLEALIEEMATAFSETYGVPRHEALLSLREEASLHPDPVSLLEDTVIRHRLMVRLGETERVRDELRSS